jgi:hypothetical protein
MREIVYYKKGSLGSAIEEHVLGTNAGKQLSNAATDV